MGKAASKKNIARAHAAHATAPDDIGPRLGILIYRCNIPAASVAVLLRVSLPTLYRWFYGINDVAAEFRKRVKKFNFMLEESLEEGTLPIPKEMIDIEQKNQVLAEIVSDGLARAKAQGVK